jgi:ABC-2 type transport system ATP-binding protein
MTDLLPRPAIAVAGLRKTFGDKVVLDGIDLRVAQGTIFALSAPTAPARPPWCRSCPP